MNTFYISDSQFSGLDSDAPDHGILTEGLRDVIDQVDSEGVWCFKGNYNLHFWCDDDKPKTIFCNAFVLLNPDDEMDSRTESHSYYFEIQQGE